LQLRDRQTTTHLPPGFGRFAVDIEPHPDRKVRSKRFSELPDRLKRLLAAYFAEKCPSLS
jgi:hypothetical protein